MDPEVRRTYLGGTDVAAIVGLNPYKSPWDVWAEKVGIVDPRPGTLRMKVGLALEPLILEEYQDVVQTPVEEWQETIRDAVYAFLGGTPDARWRDEPVGVEIKTAGFRQRSRWGEEGTDEMPEEYLAQCAWYASLARYERWDVAVLLDGDLKVYTYTRDKEFEAALREAAIKFWKEHIESERPPDPEATDRVREWLRQAYPSPTLDLRSPKNEEEVKLLEELLQAETAYKAAKARWEDLKVKVQARIGEHAGIEWPGGRVTWKATKERVATDWKAVVKAAKVPEELIRAHTTIKPGTRRFLVRRES